jgi:hypothetical protein
VALHSPRQPATLRHVSPLVSRSSTNSVIFRLYAQWFCRSVPDVIKLKPQKAIPPDRARLVELMAALFRSNATSARLVLRLQRRRPGCRRSFATADVVPFDPAGSNWFLLGFRTAGFVCPPPTSVFCRHAGEVGPMAGCWPGDDVIPCRGFPTWRQPPAPALHVG